MSNMVDLSGRARPNLNYAKVAAGQTTAQVSVSGDAVPGRDYISHIIISAVSTSAAGTVTLFDGTTSLLVHGWNATLATELVQTIMVDCVSQSTKGFNITTGTSVSVVAVGRF